MIQHSFDKSRLVSFSDAIFSIAMTLLVLEVGIPTSKLISTYTTWEILQSKIPNFIGLIVSFFVTALYWVAHLRAMKYVEIVDRKLLWLNIFLLFFIVLIPFSTGYYVRGFNHTGPFVFYCFNLSAIGLLNFLLIRYIMKKEKDHPELSPIIKKWHIYTSLNAFSIWILAGILAFALPNLARFIFILIFVIQMIINFKLKRQLKKLNNKE